MRLKVNRLTAINCYLKQLYLIQKKVIRMIAFAIYNTPSIDIICIPQIAMFIIIQQDRGTSFMSIRVTLILTQTVLVTQVLAYGMFFSPK